MSNLPHAMTSEGTPSPWMARIRMAEDETATTPSPRTRIAAAGAFVLADDAFSGKRGAYPLGTAGKCRSV
jgi:hypothetical protein